MNFLKRFVRNRGAVIGIVILLAVVAFAILAPTLYPQSPWRPVARPFLAPFVNERFPLGTDTLGRNLAAGLVHGARVSLMIGVVSTLVALVIGVPLGAVAGYAGGFVDDALMRFTEFFQTIPSFALAIVLVAILQPQLGSIVLAIGVVSWPPWRDWCEAKCSRCEVANTFRRPSRSASRRRGSSSARSCPTPSRRSSSWAR